MPTVGIFAGSRTPTDPEVLKAATLLGRKLGEAGYEITYGGGTQGVMGTIAKAVLAAGGKVNSVVLAKYRHETQFPSAHIIEVGTEQERFEAIASYNNPVMSFALPGGVTTMREVFQALEAAIYADGPPVVLVQTGNKYLEGLKDSFDLSILGGMTNAAKKDKLKLWSPASDLADVLPPAGKAGSAGPKPAIST